MGSDGLKGSGKTISLCHTLHFCYTQRWLVLHVPDGKTNSNHTSVHLKTRSSKNISALPPKAHRWVKNCKELLPSSYNSSRFDQPLQATTWLRSFRITNEPFLSKVTFAQLLTLALELLYEETKACFKSCFCPIFMYTFTQVYLQQVYTC